MRELVEKETGMWNARRDFLRAGACLAKAVAVGVPLSLTATALAASDHADPIKNRTPEVGISDLFAFPDGDQLVIILNVRPGLSSAPPFELEPFTYNIFLDLHTAVTFDDEEDLNRYGGTIPDSTTISPDVTIAIKLENDGTLDRRTITGLDEPDAVRLWTGIRDDPFILPRFFGKNVLAMVLSIPFASFPANQQDWILWGTSTRKRFLGGTEQVDHVGRSNRTMLPRFDFLNTIPPNQQTAEIRRRHDNPGLIDDLLMTYAQPFFAIRHYDFPPDVMIFTRRRPPGYPNGRLLTDDVADLTCRQGDCLLWELSFADSEQYPRQTVNDKPFLDTFPYLAEPWPTEP